MIEAIKSYIAQRGYTCTEGLVEAYCLSLQTRPFVLLTGRSDTDQTLLPRLVAEAMDATAENGRYLQLSVSPDWMDSSDLFGWLNLEGQFIPGVIIDFLKRASQDPQRPYFLCLDKLILSRADYFLRDFVAAVESMGQPTEQPFVNLLYYGRDQGAAEAYGVIPALRNVYTVGTVEIDMEGRPLNRKLLDKAFTLTLHKSDITGTDAPAPAAVCSDNRLLQTVYYTPEQCLETDIALFEQINRILTAANTYIGYKIRNDGILYLMHNRLTGAMPETAARDRIICEKILCRLQCTPKLRSILEELAAYCTAGGYTHSAQILHRMMAHCDDKGLSDYWDCL